MGRRKKKEPPEATFLEFLWAVCKLCWAVGHLAVVIVFWLIIVPCGFVLYAIYEGSKD